MGGDFLVETLIPMVVGVACGCLIGIGIAQQPPLVCEPHQKIQIETRSYGSKVVRCVAGDCKVEVLP